MKKKAIEKIAFLGLQKTSRKKDVKYIGVTAIKNVDHKRHFFMEIYKNSKKFSKVPIVRIVVTKEDFGTYFPEQGKWSRAKIRTDYYSAILIWDDAGAGYTQQIKQNILQCQEDKERIQRFFKVNNFFYTNEWWDHIYRAQDRITCDERLKASNRKYEKRQQALKDRIDHTPELPEQEILAWADRTLFKQQHFLYYRKKGPRAVICCSACGGVIEGRWRAGDTYESQFEKRISEPIDKHMGFCPMCSAAGIYNPQGLAKTTHSVSAHTFKADRYKETGAVIRYIQLEKRWELEQSVNDKGELDMVGTREILEGVEIARTYIHDGKAQTDFHKHSQWSGEEFWDDCNLYGMNKINVGDAPLYPGFSDSLKGTCLQYSAIELYAEAAGGEVNARRYMEMYLATPQIEMLVKMQLYGVVKKLLGYEYGCVADEKADRPEIFLGIHKEKLKLLIKRQRDSDILSVLQMEKRLEQKWTEEQVEALSEIQMKTEDLKQVCKIMTLQKALNLIAKYAGCEYGTGCSSAIARLRHTATMYFDYLHMREQRGYDLSNTVYQRPKNLEADHMKMIEETNKEEIDKRDQYVKEKYPLIRKNYRKLRAMYLYEDDEFIIRNARSAEEICQEGRILHHCVGGETYLRNHNEQKSIILMLRFRAEPEIPYITVEINAKTGRIVQWYGAYDKKPDEARMQKWLDAYVVRLKCRSLVVAEDSDQEVRQQVPVYA